MKYKNIKSVAHNIGHSLLSDMNATGSGSQYTIVPELLFRAAEREGVSSVCIDLRSGKVLPDSIALPEVRDAAVSYARWLPDLLVSQQVEPSAVTRATLTLEFDYSRRRQSRYTPEVGIPEFECTVEIADDRGTVHRGSPTNWWHD
jgi:hypothetical protein